MRSLLHLSLLVVGVSAKAVWESRALTYDVPSTPATSFSANYTTTNAALQSLSEALSANASMAYPNTLQYGSTIARVWPKQLETWPQAIAYPATTEDVSIIMQFYSQSHGLWEDAFAIMCGGHFSTGGAQSNSLIVDMQFLNTVDVLPQSGNETAPILRIGGGTKSGHVYDELEGTGWAFLGARSTTIGTGGFTLGGGIAYQTGAYGVGADSLVGLEMVLVNGTIVYANPYNEYSDLFWACTGGGWVGIGVVTHFYSQAYPDPGEVQVGTFVYSEDKKESVYPLVNNFFENNTDPDAFPAFLYYFKDPDYPSAVAPITERSFVLQFNALYFGSMEKFNESYGAFYDNVNSVSIQTFSLKNLKEYLSPNYPYGQSTIFRGKSHTNVSNELWNNTLAIYKETIQGMLALGEDPGNSLWVSEYIFPGYNNAGASNDSATAWPHSTSAHITLSSLMWANQSNAEYIDDRDQVMMNYLRTFQDGLDAPPIYDYPNYIAPYSKAAEVWGTDNFNRLVEIKEKYDPKCLMSRGVVIPTTACKSKGLVNYSLDD